MTICCSTRYGDPILSFLLILLVFLRQGHVEYCLVTSSLYISVLGLSVRARLELNVNMCTAAGESCKRWASAWTR